MRIAQSLLLLGLCLALVSVLGVAYAVVAIVAVGFALGAGIYIVLALGVGLVWPVLVLAYVMYQTREMSRRAAEAAAGTPTSATKANRLSIEDAQKREHRNQ